MLASEQDPDQAWTHVAAQQQAALDAALAPGVPKKAAARQAAPFDGGEGAAASEPAPALSSNGAILYRFGVLPTATVRFRLHRDPVDRLRARMQCPGNAATVHEDMPAPAPSPVAGTAAADKPPAQSRQPAAAAPIILPDGQPMGREVQVSCCQQLLMTPCENLLDLALQQTILCHANMISTCKNSSPWTQKHAAVTVRLSFAYL